MTTLNVAEAVAEAQKSWLDQVLSGEMEAQEPSQKEPLSISALTLPGVVAKATRHGHYFELMAEARREEQERRMRLGGDEERKAQEMAAMVYRCIHSQVEVLFLDAESPDKAIRLTP